ncbi:MAG: hypothetical protein ACOCVZ_07450 [Gemmatimonadota bacterium]
MGALSGRVVERATGNPIFSRAVVAALAALLALTTGASAQGIRGTAVTNVRYLTLRPIQADTVARADVIEQDGVFTFEGREVFCSRSTDACIRYIPADEAHAVVATQDISATAWGLGVQGLSATVLLRGRGDLAGDLTWPTSDDDFDAILAYAQLQRSTYRVRAGRQRTMSGLGFSGFDGVEVSVAPTAWLRAEAYGGRSLARGLNEPRHEALRAIEDFVLDQDAWLYGGFVELSPGHATSVGVRYQREIWADRIGLVSERASVDLRSDLPGPLSLDGSMDYDFAFGRVGKSHVSLRSRLPDGWGWLELTGRRYVPYFDLSTIWGFFSPTPYHEAELEATVLRLRPVTVWAAAAVREYGDPEISVIGPPITDATRRYSVGARGSAGPWRASGEYRLETGFGAFLSSGDLSVRYAPSERWALTARGSAFQQIEQFRVGENAVLGAGLGGELVLPWSARLRAGADLYTQRYENRGPADWDQLRAYTILSIPFGEDPGVRGRS